jgi:hypothetical protein
MKEKGYGRIIFTSSAAGLFGNFGQGNYGAAKMGIIGLMHVAAIEGAKYNVKANAIAPLAATRMTEGILPPDLAATMRPETVTPVVLFFAAEECRVTHRIYSCGGGRVAPIVIALKPGKVYGRGVIVEPEQIAEDIDCIDDPNGIDDIEIPGKLTDELAVAAKAFAEFEA